ncbi:MAG: 3-oxoacyl-ACP synthase, partial [Humibacillus sp.]|nr:3-oxoacyl-ACP synthase [Humibacillus sp.]
MTVPTTSTPASTPAAVKGRSRVVITDVTAVHAAGSRQQAEQRADASEAIWSGRAERYDRHLRSVGGAGFAASPPFRGVFFDDPLEQLDVTCLQGVPECVTTTSERLSLHVAETLVERGGPLPKPVHLSLADPQEDVSKQTFVTAVGVQIPAPLTSTFFDPLGVYGLLGGVGTASVSRTTEASASGTVALVDAVQRLERGSGGCAIVTAASGKSIPIPFETTPLGAGADRSALPFSDAAAGHYNAEGAVGLVVRDEASARVAGVPILARVAGYAYGTFGSRVVNRAVVSDVVLRALADADIDPQTPVLVDLYGRGNRIDDSAELSAMERVRQVYPALATAYLKGETHYVIGAHGLQGLVRLLEARATAAPVA